MPGIPPLTPLGEARPDPAGDVGAQITRRWLALRWHVLPLAFFAAVVLFYPFRFVFELDPDEGINLIKSLLTLRGFDLYSEVWNDQPPVFTLLLSLWFRILGTEVLAGRLLVLLISCAQAAILADLLRRSWGASAAISGFVFLVFLPQYVRLSVSIMIGLPAISGGMLAVWALARWHSSRHWGWLALSSATHGLAIFTKGFVVVLLPVLTAGVLVATASRSGPGVRRRPAWAEATAWVAPMAAVAAWAIFLHIGPENLGQILKVHLVARDAPEFQARVAGSTIHDYLRHSLPLLLLALLGALHAVRARDATGLYLGGWALSAYALLLVNRPTWAHHELLVTVPAAGLAGIAAGVALRDLPRQLRSRPRSGVPLAVTAATLAAFAAVLVTRVPDVVKDFDTSFPNVTPPPAETIPEAELVALLWDHAAETRWIYTESPIFAFLTDLLVPPELAVLTQKRLATGDLTDAQVLAILERYSPEVVLQSRFFLPASEEYMHPRNFRRVDSAEKYRLYFRQTAP